MQHGLCLPSCRLSSEHTTRLRGDSRIEKGRLEGTGPRPPQPRSSIRVGCCINRGTILRVKYLAYFTTHKTAPLGATKSWKSIVNVLHMLDVVSSENREKTLRFVLTFYRQATDRLPTHYQQSADCRPTGSLYFGQNLSAVCQPTVGWQTADSRPTVGWQTTNCRPTVDQQLTNSRPTGFLGSSSSQLPMTWLPTQPSIVPLLLVLSLSNKIKCF